MGPGRGPLLERGRRLRGIPPAEAGAGTRRSGHPGSPRCRVRAGGVVRLPIRLRLTGWYLGVLAVLLLAVGAFLLVRLHSSLVAEIDRSLDARAVQIAAGFRGGGEGEFRDLSDATLEGLPRGESAAQLVGRAGVLESSGDAVAATPMVPAPLLRAALAGTTVRD